MFQIAVIIENSEAILPYLRFGQLSTVISHLQRAASSDLSIVPTSNSKHISLIDLESVQWNRC